MNESLTRIHTYTHTHWNLRETTEHTHDTTIPYRVGRKGGQEEEGQSVNSFAIDGGKGLCIHTQKGKRAGGGPNTMMEEDEAKEERTESVCHHN